MNEPRYSAAFDRTIGDRQLYGVWDSKLLQFVGAICETEEEAEKIAALKSDTWNKLRRF